MTPFTEDLEECELVTWKTQTVTPQPERWMCVVVRREKLHFAVGRLVEVSHVSVSYLLNPMECLTSRVFLFL
ncbi:hypothetical protein BJ165DRAFT_1467026 [Panaeolus papilionaceus]|nr:hypothetical protein BJ165DRAFT_1467026 [Panaeolus papilionaceus]